MAGHPNKEIDAAVDYALSLGWRLKKGRGHAHTWGTLLCLEKTREGCQVRVYSTPRNPQKHANWIRHEVDRCPH